jgi:8-oxo-dGTP pyrophosphatase MutT (NUDIX family)
MHVAIAPRASPSLALTVAAVVERDGRFLMVEEWVHGRPVVNQPAGDVEANESLLAAVSRETLEETGWTFAPVAVTGIYLWQRPGTNRSILRVAFLGRCLHHEPDRKLDSGIIRALWLTRTELLHRTDTLRSPMVMRAIDDYLAGARSPLGQLTDVAPETLLRRAERL